ncbi:e3 ubiquitin-protein ligase TRAIP [Caerostris darwini]|uniref:E3 ubiquitin-protein ligase TRAIP n=1 Tax=Caerostris darwini TaxID=1538125 RepID=A0AAV4SRU0_9ARAC|nr:e3 ubiquitin-protein ligase TRAIP [Caerostris darwini]
MRCSCVICTDLYDTGKDIVTIPCGHVFHFKCLTKWIDRSKTCPECRRPVISKDIKKLYFNIASDNDLNASNLENRLSTLKAELSEKDIELNESKKKIKQLQLHAADVEKTLSDMHQNHLKLEHDISIYKVKLTNMTSLEIKLQRFKQENDNLMKELEHLNNVKLIVASCQKDVDDVLKKMQIELSVECGHSAAVRMATYCSVIKREFFRVVDEKNQLRNEVAYTKKSLGLAKADLQALKKKFLFVSSNYASIDSPLSLRDSFEKNTPKSNTIPSSSFSTPKTEISNSNLPSKETKNEELTPISVNFSGKKKKIGVVVVDKEVRKLSATEQQIPEQKLSWCNMQQSLRHKKNDEDSVSRVDYDGLGGHRHVIMGMGRKQHLGKLISRKKP